MEEEKNDLGKLIKGFTYWNIQLKDPSIEKNYETRFLLQKIAYLCKVLGISIRYDFGLYLNGPYSPDLTRDYYKYSKRVVNKKSAYTPSDKEKKIYELIKNEILSDSETEDHLAAFLEALATILYFRKEEADLLDDDLFAKIKEIKPYLSDRLLIIALNKAKELIFKPEYLTADLKEELDLWESAED